jgi:hypothetical protein
VFSLSLVFVSVSPLTARNQDLAECFYTRQRAFLHLAKALPALGKGFVGKGTLPSVFYRNTRQNIFIFCRVPGKTLGKIFGPSRQLSLTVTLPSAGPALGIFFIF